MARYSEYDSDDERLPEGMQRIGYDADTQTYTYRDADGSIWESAPGARYGHLTKVSDPPSHPPSRPRPFGNGVLEVEVEVEVEGDDDCPPPPYHAVEGANRRPRRAGYTPLDAAGSAHESAPSWRTELMPLMNFFLLVGLFLLAVFWLVRFYAGRSDTFEPDCGTRAVPYTIHRGDTCWDVAQRNHISLEDLLAVNTGLDCNALNVGGIMCLPTP